MAQIDSIGSFLNHRDKNKSIKNSDTLLQAYTKIKINNKSYKKSNNSHERVKKDQETLGISTNVTKKTNKTNKNNRKSVIQCSYQNKSKSHSNQNRYATPNRNRYLKASNQDDQLSSMRKIKIKQKVNYKKKGGQQSVQKKKDNQRVIDFSDLMENKSKSTNKFSVIKGSFQKQYTSNQQINSIQNKKIRQFYPIYDVNLNDRNNDKRAQSQRVEKLKKYLLSDTQRMTKMKRQSDEHVIEQFHLSEKILSKNLQQIGMQRQKMKKQAQKLLKDTKDRYQQELSLNKREIQHLKDQLDQQKSANKKTEAKLKQLQLKMVNIRQQYQNKSIQTQNLSKIVQKIKKQRDNFQLQLKKSHEQKELIKQQVQEVLGIVQQEIYTNVGTI